MRITITNASQHHRKKAGVTLIDVMFGSMIIGVMVTVLYLGFSSGFALIQLARENLRATQILQEKMETVRLYTWEQINMPGFIPTSFKAPFYAVGNDTTGLIYDGTVTWRDNPVTESYAADLRQVTMTVTWTSGNVTRRRDMTTYISRYGLHDYIY